MSSPVQQAVALYAQGHYREALERAHRALAEQPRDVALMDVAAFSALALGSSEVAEHYWRQAVSVRPDYADAHSNLGILLQADKRFEEAEQRFRQALAIKPEAAASHGNYGILLQQWQRFEEAEACFRKALALQPGDAVAHYNLGVLLQQLQRFAAAERCYRDALAIWPDYADAHYNLGLLLHAGKRGQEAEACYRQALAGQPDHAAAHASLGELLQELARFDEAELSYRQALSLQPEDATLHRRLAVLLQARGRFEDAEASYRRALAIDPGDAVGHNNLGCVLHKLGRFQEAQASYRQALAIRPAYAEAQCNLGIALQACRQYEQARACYDRALQLDPDYAEGHCNLGILCKEERRFDEAEQRFRRALSIQPDYAAAHCNLGIVLLEGKQFEAAEACYRQALALQPDNADFSFNLSVLLLHTGRLEEGWRRYESRYDLSAKELAFPQWQGQSLAGKTLLIWREQGFGDQIQFCRFLPLLKAQGAAFITLTCTAPLAPLLQTLDGVDRVLIREQDRDIPVHDYWAFPMSLPLHFDTGLATIPANPPYLHALPERARQWAPRLPAAGLRVGLVWKGHAGHSNDGNRSLPGLAALAPLWRIAGVAFVSLQKGQGEAEAMPAPPEQPLLQVGSDIGDFADSAAIVAQLDLIICVDTAIAHLAGALNRPVWVLLPFLPDWRWMEAREDSPWYPNTRLFRQRRAGDWAEVVERVAGRLRAVVAGECPASWPVEPA